MLGPDFYDANGWMTRDSMLAYLCRHGKHLSTVDSRYGATTVEAAPVAIALAHICEEGSGEPTSEAALDFYMALVVNDSPAPAQTLREDGWRLEGTPEAALLDEDWIFDPPAVCGGTGDHAGQRIDCCDECSHDHQRAGMRDHERRDGTNAMKCA